ncbi:peptidoglycan recognition protein [Kitasatospora sp. NPDC048545]|uniref:peptidoglycan recognition protein family protein n=1 Tax=Kitasatospora sp. NPDC048545 TaxID=3157208 RepID=UPI00340F3FFC
MSISIPAAVLAGCTTALLLQPAAVAVDGSSSPTATLRTSVGGGSVTSLAFGAGGVLAPRETRPFELLGVVWDGAPDALAQGSVRVRTRDSATGRWSDWRQLEADAADAPDTVPRGATAPLWAGRSDGVAVDVRPGPAGLPRGLRVELVDPGQGAATTDRQTVPERPAGPTDTAGRPEIVTRAGWGADESIREAGFGYTGPVRAVFVHHTASATDYACSDAPRIIRSIYQYHVQSNGWRDIGYNFLVDRCGTVYEGRAGGVDQPVLGAHTLGFNSNSAGVSAIGTYTSDVPPQALQDGLAKIAAWKLGLTGQMAGGTTRLTSSSDGSRYPKGTVVDFDTISGHRDGFATECPGGALYARLPAIRSAALILQDG